MRMPTTLLALAVLLAGCGAQSLAPRQAAPQGLKARAAQSFFPASPDGVWQYEVTAHPADDPYVDYKGTETVRVESVERRGGATTLKLRAIDDFTNRYRFPVITETAEGVKLSGVTYWGTAADDVETHTIDFLHFPLKSGDKWDDGLWVGETKGKQKVSVPAGSFDAWRVSVIGTYDREYTAVGSYWVVAGKGIVKSELNIPGWIIESELIPAGSRRLPGRPLPKGLKLGR